jgi:hypothetical protein
MISGSRSDLQCTIATLPRSHVVAYGVVGSPPLARRPVAWGAPSVAAYGLRRGTLALPLQKRDACSLVAHRITFAFIPLCLTQLRNLQTTLSQAYNHHTSFYTFTHRKAAATMPPKKDTATISVRPDGLAGEKCIITGEIDGMTRKAAEQILINAGATIEKSLNKKVTLVVLGENAGEKKVSIPILSMRACAELPSSRKSSSLAASQKSGMR